MGYDMELHANGKQYGIAFERNGKLFQNDDIDYNIYGFYINGEKVGEFGHTYPIKATFNINKYLPLIEKMIHNESFIWAWEKANAINESKRTIKLSESILREIITESVKNVLRESSSPFADAFNRAKSFRTKYGGSYGFELRKNGKWQYGDIEYDPNKQIMSCMGVSIKVSPEMTIADAEEDLFEALLNAGYESDF